MEYGDELGTRSPPTGLSGLGRPLAPRDTLAQPSPERHLCSVGHPSTWLRVLPQGLFCVPGDFFIDPTRAVDRAIVTHAHSDHARPGSRAVAASPATLALMRARMGEAAWQESQPLAWGERIRVGEVMVWLQPAGHVLGSAQVA